jgi:WD40 repeat protein
MSTSEIKPKYILTSHTSKITDLCLSKFANSRLFSVSLDKNIILWDICKGIKLIHFTLDSPINCITLDISEDYVLTGCKNTNIYM